MNSLAGSVGEGGMNHAMDVAMVQTMLFLLQSAIGTWHDQLRLRVSVQAYNDCRDLEEMFALMVVVKS